MVKTSWVFESYRRLIFFVMITCSVFLSAELVQMKSSMTFIGGIRCIERERYFNNGREVKRLKECALALSSQRGYRTLLILM